ncbi:sugar O-acetyltransferase [Pseudomonas sp. FP2309]|uniref:sugar O-acetyltransferase n=1 Tax=Pseudomonas sp. FP2309 TaxID=2954091 RepID=UPI00351ED5B4
MSLRKKTKTLCGLFNATAPDEDLVRLELINAIFGGCGRSPIIEPPFYCDYGTNITIGDNFYANHGLVILDGAEVVIGSNVFIAPGVGIHTAGHPVDFDRRNQGMEYALPVTIGNNAWIGASATILSGVTIGYNSVIGAGSVVVRDIPANVIAVGNPCHVIREITSDDAMRNDFRRTRN